MIEPKKEPTKDLKEKPTICVLPSTGPCKPVLIVNGLPYPVETYDECVLLVMALDEAWEQDLLIDAIERQEKPVPVKPDKAIALTVPPKK